MDKSISKARRRRQKILGTPAASVPHPQPQSALSYLSLLSLPSPFGASVGVGGGGEGSRGRGTNIRVCTSVVGEEGLAGDQHNNVSELIKFGL